RLPTNVKKKNDINTILSSINNDKMVDFVNLSERQDIKVVCCERAWFLLKQKPPVFRERNRLIKVLREIKTANPNEALAKELYIRKIEKQGFCRKRIILSPEEARAILLSSDPEKIRDLDKLESRE
ncbi:MAG: hypothetical protein NC828_03595, partial [Candidatus Omnitrophica bacterium]|nr:hypothetical protein [Candidatus Omnitrophota bacterium]